MGNRKEQQKKADKVAQAVSRECLPSKREAPNSNLSTAKKKKKICHSSSQAFFYSFGFLTNLLKLPMCPTELE
jgi:hypothetical protein